MLATPFIPLEKLQFFFIKDLFVKHRKFIEITYSYPLIKEIKECVIFNDLIKSLLSFYEKNKTFFQFPKELDLILSDKNEPLRLIYNDFKHHREYIELSSRIIFEYHECKKLFKFVKNSITAKHKDNKTYHGIEEIISKVVSAMASKLGVKNISPEIPSQTNQYYPFVCLYFHWIETPMLVKGGIRGSAMSYVRNDGNIINTKDIDYKYSIYRLSANGRIEETEECFVPIIYAEYMTGKILGVCLNSKGGSINCDESWNLEQNFFCLANQKFKIAIDDLGFGYILYDYDKNYTQDFKKDKTVITLNSLNSQWALSK